MKWCIEFDGVVGSWGDAPGIPAFDSSACTVEAWIRTDARVEQTIVLFPSEPGGATPRLSVEADRLHVFWNTDGDGPGSWSADTSPICDGVWHHVAVVTSGGQLRFFKDGKFCDAVPLPSGLAGGSLAQIGPALGTATTFDGAIADLRVWSVARTVDQIAETMHRSLPAATAGLVANWSFVGGAFVNLATGSADELVGDGARVVPIRARPDTWFGGWVLRGPEVHPEHTFATLYAALVCASDGHVTLKTDSAGVKTLRDRLQPGAQVIGGMEGDLRPMLVDPAARTAFVADTVAACHACGLDGLDLDFEAPQQGTSTPEMMQGFSDLCGELGSAVMPSGLPLSLGVTLFNWSGTLGKYQWPGLVPYVDRFEIMSYESAAPPNAGDPPTPTGIACDLDAVASTVGYLVSNDVAIPRDRIVVGVPLYVRAWTGVEQGPSTELPGLGEPGTMGPYDQSGWADMMGLGEPYEAIGPSDGKLSYLYNARTQGFINLLTPAALRCRGAYGATLGGAWIWYLGLDGSAATASGYIAEGLLPAD